MVRVSYGKLFRETMGVELLIEAGIVVEQWA
jgi:hypothetical protein